MLMRRMSDEISWVIPGRPGRFGVNVHVRAISCRCHRKIVSGVTIVATCLKTRRPSRRPFAARRRLVVGQPEAALLHLLREDTVLLHQVLDDVLLVAVDPSREGDERTCKGETSAVIGQSYRASRRTPYPGTGLDRVFGHYALLSAALQPVYPASRDGAAHVEDLFDAQRGVCREPCLPHHDQPARQWSKCAEKQFSGHIWLSRNQPGK